MIIDTRKAGAERVRAQGREKTALRDAAAFLEGLQGCGHAEYEKLAAEALPAVQLLAAAFDPGTPAKGA